MNNNIFDFKTVGWILAGGLAVIIAYQHSYIMKQALMEAEISGRLKALVDQLQSKEDDEENELER